jgi:hypothetical protein
VFDFSSDPCAERFVELLLLVAVLCRFSLLLFFDLYVIFDSTMVAGVKWVWCGYHSARGTCFYERSLPLC